MGGAAALSLHAPEASAALASVVPMRPFDVGEATFGALRTITAGALGLTSLSAAREQRMNGVPEPGLVAFAEQFAVDVSRIDEGLREAWSAATGKAAYSAVLVVYVADFVPRLRAALDALFGADEWFEPPVSVVSDPWSVLDDFLSQVARLSVIDATTTELIRVRGARQHECRICQSRRSLAAVEEGATAATFAALDHYRTSDLSPKAQAALALTDAMIWTPATIRASDLDAVRRHLSPAEAVEVALDVTRNAANKIAVALAADAPEVTNGVELFEVDADGRVTFP